LRLAAELTDAQVSVYSIDARGLQTGGYSLTTENSQDTLLTLASQSGGLIFKNRNDVAGAVAVSVADGSAYYLLGYYPESKQWDGKFHKIQVKLNKPGLEVRHRTGYFAIDPNQFAKSKDKKNDPELNAAMSLGAPMATMVIFDSRVVPPAPASKMNVPIEFLVNPRTIAGEDMKNGGRHFIIEFHAAA